MANLWLNVCLSLILMHCVGVSIIMLSLSCKYRMNWILIAGKCLPYFLSYVHKLFHIHLDRLVVFKSLLFKDCMVSFFLKVTLSNWKFIR